MDKVGLALGGLVAAGGVAAAMHAMNVKIIKIYSKSLFHLQYYVSLKCTHYCYLEKEGRGRRKGS